MASTPRDLPRSALCARPDHDTAPTTLGGAVWFQLAVAIAGRPRLWATALRQWRRVTPRGWWRRRPWLPVPPRAYVRFRLETAFGPGPRADAPDLLEYLEWCRAGKRQD